MAAHMENPAGQGGASEQNFADALSSSEFNAPKQVAQGNPPERLKQLSAALDRTMQSDRKFFERFPARKHRVRLASRAEIAEMETIAGRDCGPVAGIRIYVAVKNIAPGLRIRTHLTAPADCDVDLTEAQAAEIFVSCAGAMHQKLEAKMREAADMRGDE
jgi:hypothetical protein